MSLTTQTIKCGESGTWTAALIDKATGDPVDSTSVTHAKVVVGEIEYLLDDAQFEAVVDSGGDYLQFSLDGTQTASFSDQQTVRVEVKVILADGRECFIAEELWIFENKLLSTWHG